MDAAKALDRVAKLVARSASPFEQEARTAAFMACEIIRAQSLHIGPPSPRADGGELERLRREISALRAKCVALDMALTQSRAISDPLIAERNRLRAELEALRRPPVATGQPDGPRQIRARFESRCASCGNQIFEGEPILWRKGSRPTCLDCVDWWEK